MSAIKRFLYSLCFVSAVLLLTSCASKEAINVKIHTDPEGSHLVYQVNDDKDAPWIYLGVTPYQGATLMDSSSLDNSTTITFKVMRRGYLDQVKKWTGEQLLEEYESAGQIFWAPRLVKPGK